MSHRKQPERRTFLQDRFEILIKRQMSGEATFNELTELDEIVNRDPEIRDRVIRENMLMSEPDEFNEPSGNRDPEAKAAIPGVKRLNLLNRLKSFVGRIFTSQISSIRSGSLVIGKELIFL